MIQYLLFPLRVVLPQHWLKRLGLMTLAEERVEAVKPWVKGRLLDIGCGENLLVKAIKNGVGVDIVPWKGVDVVCDTSDLPFANKKFNCVTFLACLNHIPNRESVLQDAHRVLKPGGSVIITMIPRALGFICHKMIAHWDPDQTQREMDHKEEWGLNHKEVLGLLKLAGFKNVKHKRFSILGLNHLYIAKKRE